MDFKPPCHSRQPFPPPADLSLVLYWAHISGGELDVIGASLPGSPIVVSGSNPHVAWGLTDSYMTVGDLVAIPKEDTAEFQSERPTIWVKFGFLKLPFFFKRFLRSKEGLPVLPIDAPEGRVLVMRWTGFHVTGRQLSEFPQWMVAHSVAEVDRILAHTPLPSFNYVFSDTSGVIGYRVVGLIPKEEHPIPFGFRKQSYKDLNHWPFLQPEEMPHVLNPPRGFVVTANNRQWPEGSRFHIGRAYHQGFRAFRLEELLARTHEHRMETIAAAQCDSQALEARFLLPRLLTMLSARPALTANWDTRKTQALEFLKNWDYATPQECRACVVYQRWINRIGQDIHLDTSALYHILQRIAGEAKPEGFGDVSPYAAKIAKAFEDALSDIEKFHPREIPTWGEAHRAYFRHIADSPLFESDKWIPTPGNQYSVTPGTANWEGGYYSQTVGVSMRLIAEMSDPPTAYFAWPGTARDEESHDITRADSPWMKWRDCRFEKVPFPLDWTGLKTEVVDF